MKPKLAPSVAPSTAGIGAAPAALASCAASGAINVAVAVLLVTSDNTIAMPVHNATMPQVEWADVKATKERPHSAANPVEFAWRIAAALNAECFLFPAPLVVNSAETKRTLIQECGLEPLYRMAQKMDLAVVSVGDINQNSTSLVRHMITAREHRELVELGCVGVGNEDR